MTHWLDRVVTILESDTSDLRSLALIAGGDPRRFYVGVRLDQLDLEDQHLEGMLFSDASGVVVEFDRAALPASHSVTAEDSALAGDPEAIQVSELSDFAQLADATNPGATEATSFGEPIRALATVDLGANKTACFILGEAGVDRARRTLVASGAGVTRSNGVRRERIVQVEQASKEIAEAVARAESVARVSIHSVTLSTAGGQLESHTVAAEIALPRKAIANVELSKAISLAVRRVQLPSNRRAIHYLPIQWSVDAQRNIRDPRQMFGRKLSVELIVVSIDRSHVDTLAQCVASANLTLERVVASPFASALAACSTDEIEQGVICIDLGAGTTSVAVMRNGALHYVDSIPIGGDFITQDVANALMTTIAAAERIKILYGSAIGSGREDREMLEVPPRDEHISSGPVTFPRSMLKGIIAPRVVETLEIVRNRLVAAGTEFGGKSIVLAGGGSQLIGVREVTVRVFDMPVRLGRPSRMPEFADVASGPAYCASVGTLQRAVFGPREAIPAKALLKGVRQRRLSATKASRG